jgi:hypothetical protein
MSPAKNAMQIFQYLDKSNCRDCGEKTCLAFAGAVFTGQKKIDACPKLPADILRRFSDEEAGSTTEQNRDDYLEDLKKEIAQTDLAEAAKRIDARFFENKLTLKVLGKDFSVDTQGRLYTDIHVNPWVAVPFLNYILHGKGLPVSGNWKSFRELNEGKARYPLFQKRCENVIKKVADTYTELFNDMVHLFNGRKVAEQFESDISVVLHPLPKLPLMVCYWLPEDGLASSLNLFFDETADQNLDIGAIFSLGAGLAQMFTKLAQRHGYTPPDMI